jgi:hypothetical protein
MINYFIFVLLSFPEIKTEGFELHCSLWEQKEEYFTGEPVFLRVSVVNTSLEKIYVFPIDISMGFTNIYMSIDGKKDKLETGAYLNWAFPSKSSDPNSWAPLFYRLEKGDSIYEYIFINEPWEYDIPPTAQHYEIEEVRHGLRLEHSYFHSSLEKCPFSPLGGQIEKEFQIKFNIVPPQEAEELKLITIIRNPNPIAPRKSWEEKKEAYNRLEKEYPNSPYLPLAMSIVEKRKFLETYPNSPLVYEIIRKVSKIGIQGLDIPPWVKNKFEYRRDYQESFGDFNKEKCLKYFNSFLANEKYKGTLLEDAILLWIDDVEKGNVKVWREPSSTSRRKIK